MPSLPSATILVLNYNGRAHLEQCLPSLAALDYPGVSVTVIDNGSSDSSLAYIARHHHGVHVLPLGSNRGFAPAYNIAVRQATSDVVVLLNNDTRVASTWLRELIDTLERHQAAAASSCMLDWDGGHVDFAGSLPTFIGHAWQVDHGHPVGRAYGEVPLLFGCAGSLAVRRQAFLDVGGFDDDYFVYFEDLDLGWRMSLAGMSTVLSPKAITYHRLHGTASGWGLTLRMRMYERNALFTLFKNYGDEALRRVLPAALVLTLARALKYEDLDDGTIQFGRRSPAHLSLPPRVVSTLLALEDFARALPALAHKRRHVQALRRVDDEALFTLFPEPLKLHDAGDAYREAAQALIHDFGIAELFGLSAPFVGARHTHANDAPAAQDEHARRQPLDGHTVAAPGGVAFALEHNPSAVSALTSTDAEAAAPQMRPGVVSVIVLTASGAEHLPECLGSLRDHTWPAALTEVIVVDNGSRIDPTVVAERHYPGVRVVRTGANLGFSGGNNAGAAVATGEWLVFLNDDTRVAPDWLDELMDVATRRKAASVGAFIVDWAGTHVDFAGGLVNFEGRGFSLGHDGHVDEADRTERPLLFGCGAAVLFRRDVFDATGGWDTPTFAYYEDVEFGWRLWMLGHEVWFAPRAIVYHRHHGTSGTESAARIRAFERNALRMLYTLLEPATLRQVLPAAILLATDRALLGTVFSRADEGVTAQQSWRAVLGRLRPGVVRIRLLHALSRRGARRHYGLLTNLRRVGLRGLAGAALEMLRDLGEGWEHAGGRVRYLLEASRPHAALEGLHEQVPAATVAQMTGFSDFIDMLPELSERRAWLQARRRRTDADILDLFGGCWMNAVPSPKFDLHQALREGVIRELLTPPSTPDSPRGAVEPAPVRHSTP